MTDEKQIQPQNKKILIKFIAANRDYGIYNSRSKNLFLIIKIKVLATFFLLFFACKRNYSGDEVSKVVDSEKVLTLIEEEKGTNELAESIDTDQKDELKSTSNQRPIANVDSILPISTILFLKTTTDIYAKNFEAGNHFFNSYQV